MKKNEEKRVKIIKRDGAAETETALIEWVIGEGETADWRRGVLPVAQLKRAPDGTYTTEATEEAAPAGPDWDTLLCEIFGAEASQPFALRLGRELRRRGLWTAQAVRENAPLVLSAIQAANGATYARLVDALKARGV